ncbi:BamA/TamA family outer membrane protein [Rufibacter soli]
MKILCLQLFLCACCLSVSGNNLLSPQDSTKTNKLRILPVPSFGYSPETRWYGGAVAMFTKRLGADTLTRTSNGKVEAIFTQNKQQVFSLGWNVFTPQDQYFLTGDLSYNQFPENFYGIGNRTTNDMEELYDSRRLEAKLVFQKQIGRKWYLGPRVQLQHMDHIEPKPEGLLATQPITGQHGGTSAGLGYTLTLDKRDNLLNPLQHGYLSVSQLYFGKGTQSDFFFVRYELDARRYWPLSKNTEQVLAAQTIFQFHTGQPPFRMLSLLGSDADMRGYYRGRFRDRQYLAGQVELRQPLFWRLGAVAFAGAGQVASSLGDISLAAFKPSYGGGLRFKIDRKENVNLRLDYAVGQNSTGFYVAFGEAF